MAHMSRDANVVGACALAIAGRLPAGAHEAALVSLSTWLAGSTVDGLARAVGLTHSGAVRLADRLEADGLLERRPGPDGRTRALHLTPAGLRTAGDLQAERFGGARGRAGRARWLRALGTGGDRGQAAGPDHRRRRLRRAHVPAVRARRLRAPRPLPGHPGRSLTSITSIIPDTSSVRRGAESIGAMKRGRAGSSKSMRAPVESR